ncbi:hypothetical protein BJ170DRAFT_684087 [Xylariales sp. AK1849]|nr:hypothetical protein BJ170DRAFT_684087 [Xylariales sp. AK1849]
MCYLAKLDCFICKYQKLKCSDFDPNDYEEEDDPDSPYIFQPCENFQKMMSKYEGAQEYDIKSLKPGERFHCPDLLWPPEPNILTRWICEDCVSKGRKIYRFNIETERAKKSLERQSRARHSNSGESDEEEDNTEEDRFRHLPDDFIALNAKTKDSILRLFYKNHEIAGKPRAHSTAEEISREIETYWIKRSSEAVHRSLTIWIPRCVLCKKPTTRNEEEAGGIADIELEPNSIMWKWLPGLKKERVVQTQIKTGFLQKPCESCIKEESHLRNQVCQFLKENVYMNCVGWIVYSWLLSRGLGNVPVFDHAALNVAYPDKDPPTIQEILGLMALSWKRLTGVAWEDNCDLDPPVSCAVACTIHDEPFVRLDQWPETKNDIPLELRHTYPGIDDMVEDDAMDDVVQESTGDGATPQISIVEKVQTFLESLSKNKLAMASIQKSSGLSTKELNRAFSVTFRALGGADDVADQIEVVYAPMEVEVSRSRNFRCQGQKKLLLKRTEKKEGLFVTVKGAYIDMMRNKATRKTLLDEKATEATHTRDSIRLPPVGDGYPMFDNDGAHFDGRYQENLPEGKHGHLPGGADLVREASTPVNSENDVGDGMFEDSESSRNGAKGQAGPSTAKNGDVDMGDEYDDMPDLGKDEGAIVKCDMDCWHLLETKGIPSREMIYLPLGIHHDEQEE